MRNRFLPIIIGIIVLLLVGFIFIAKMLSPIYEDAKITDLDTIVEGLIYVGKVDEEAERILKSYNDTYSLKAYNMANVDIDELNEVLEKYSVNSLEKEGYVLICNNVPVWSSPKDIVELDLDEAIDEFFYGKIPEDKIAYKVPLDGDSMIKLIKKKNYTVLVIGKEDCNYCTMYKPIFNDIAKEHNLDIYYIDVDTYSTDEYEKIQDLELEIPAKCTLTGEDTNIKGSFPKPMTIVTYNGKTEDCILGYASKAKLETMLYSFNMID